MKSFLTFIFISATALFFTGCSRLPINTDLPTTQIIVGDGPEDMVLDTVNGFNRLIISCTDRRSDPYDFGGIVTFNLETGGVDTLERINEPESIVFRPHGIYMEGSMLYVISHEHEPDDHIVLIYTIENNRLLYNDVIRSDMLISPNALVTGPKGEIYVVNDSGKRGSLAEKLFKLKKANVIKYEKLGEKGWIGSVAAEKMGYPAGINRIADKLFVGDAVLHKFHVFNISGEGLNADSEIMGLTGNDNIRIYEGKLISPGHVKPFKFVGHAKDPEKISPVEVYLVDPESGSFETLFFDDGSRISAGSTAIIYKNRMYICQVFEPYLLQVDLN